MLVRSEMVAIRRTFGENSSPFIVGFLDWIRHLGLGGAGTEEAGEEWYGWH